jgi:branched-chain amino acid transport system permease protein
VKPVTNRRAGKLLILSLVLIFLMALPFLITNPYWQHLLIMALLTSVLGMTFSMIFGCAGMVNLGTGAFFGIGAYASTLMVMKMGWSFWIALPLATLVAGTIALGFGLISVRNPGIAFLLLTMIFAEIITQATAQIPFLGGWGGFMVIPRPNPIGPIKFMTKVPYYYLMLTLFLLIVVTFQSLYSSRIGRVWKAISLSPNLAQTLGINIYRYRVLAFVIASLTAGLVGSFYAHYSQTIAPVTFGGFFSILVQLYPILGGIDFYILGPTLGATLMTFIPEYLRITEEVEPIITGSLLLIIIIFFPEGILGRLAHSEGLRRQSLLSRLREMRIRFSREKPKQ